jgi:Mg/Co/Ni transporter MgtE
VTTLPDALAADTLEAMTLERQVQVFEELNDDYAVRVLELMAPDRATDLVSALDPEIIERCLNALPTERRDLIVELLRFPDDVAGGIMTNDVVRVPAEATIAEARVLLSDRLRVPDFVYFLYAVEGEESSVLRGVVTLREFVIAEDDCRIEEIMQPNLVAIDPLETALDAARRVADSGLTALPVVGNDGRLLGAVTLDAALAQLAPAWRAEIPRVFS